MIIHGDNIMPSGVYERTPKIRAAISKALTGRPRTPEHCAALSKATKGENNPMYGKRHSEEARKKISKAQKGIPRTSKAQLAAEAQRGVPLSSEHCAAISKGKEESRANDKMRGGNDICTHHYIYDHSDLSLNAVQMTRSDHQRLHRLLQKLGYVVPHINIKVYYERRPDG